MSTHPTTSWPGSNASNYTMLLTLIPSLQASRIYPAEALRYE